MYTYKLEHLFPPSCEVLMVVDVISLLETACGLKAIWKCFLTPITFITFPIKRVIWSKSSYISCNGEHFIAESVSCNFHCTASQWKSEQMYNHLYVYPLLGDFDPEGSFKAEMTFKVRVYSGKLFTNQVSQSAKQSVAHATYQHADG